MVDIIWAKTIRVIHWWAQLQISVDLLTAVLSGLFAPQYFRSREQKFPGTSKFAS